MRIERVTIGMDWKNTENYNSDRYSISFTAELESGDVLEQVEQKLYDQCRAYLEKVSANGRKNGNHAVLAPNGGNGQKSQNPPAPAAPAPAVPAEKVQKETRPQPPARPEPSTEPKNEKPDIWNDRRYRPWDNRNRPVQQLIEELKIRSVNHAGLLRAQDKISYKEWKAVHDFLNMREIAEHEQAEMTCGER